MRSSRPHGKQILRRFALCGLTMAVWGVVSLSGGSVAAADSPPELLQITEAQFGFDGAIQRRTFVPLSFEARNLGLSPWKGRVRISRSTGRGQRLGAELELELSLQGEEARSVQVLVYVLDEFDDWLIEWGPSDRQQYRISNLQTGPKATVLIYDPDAVIPSTGVLRKFPEHLFPTSVTATGTLRGIVLTHAPFWQGARARAFLDWLSQGGRVYLLQNDQSAFPRFPQVLDQLNQPENRYSVGLGVVQRIPISLKDLTLDEARAKIFLDDLPPITQRGPGRRGTTGSLGLDGGHSWSRDSKLFNQLSKLATFERRWWLIFLMVGLYLAALFPGCYWLGCHTKDVRPFYLAFFGAVAGFSLLFAMLGQLGASTPNRIRSAAIAHALGNQRFQVTQWSHLAVVNEKEYHVQHGTLGTWYSTCQETEKVDGTFAVGSETIVTLNMPPASSRTLLHIGTITRTSPDAILSDVLVEYGRLERLSFSINGCYQGQVQQAIAVHQGNLYRLVETAGTFGVDRTKPVVPLLQELADDERWRNLFPLWSPLGFTPNFGEKKNVSRLAAYRELSWWLIGNAFGLSESVPPRSLHLGEDVVRIMVQVPMPSEFFSLTPDFPDQEGAVLFVHDFLIPGGGR